MALHPEIRFVATENLLDYQDDDYHDDDDYYDDDDEKSRVQRWRAAIARCGFWTLVLAVAAPASLHCIEIFFLHSPQSVSSKPSWFPKKLIDMISVHLSILISLSFWFGWAENGAILRPKLVAAVSILYLSLALAWDQIVFEYGAIKCGIAILFARYLLGQQLSDMIRELNQTASKLVMNSLFFSTSYPIYYNLLLLV